MGALNFEVTLVFCIALIIMMARFGCQQCAQEQPGHEANKQQCARFTGAADLHADDGVLLAEACTLGVCHDA